MQKPLSPLNDVDRSIYEWQMWMDGVGEEGQQRLKNTSVLISRVGGVGGSVAYELAAAGVGRLILAHGGNLKPSDLNRQLLMTHDWIGKPRVESAARRLKELNPALEVVPFNGNLSDENAAGLVSEADIVVDCAPLFEERFAMNRAAVAQGKPMVECSMYAMEGHVTTIIPGKTGCLRCLYPEFPEHWKRQFPVFGATAGCVGSLGAMEVIKYVTGVGRLLLDTLLVLDLKMMRFRQLRSKRVASCPVCGNIHTGV